jgi:hypothetical protein
MIGLQAVNIVANHHSLIRSIYRKCVIPADPNDKYSIDEHVVLCDITPHVVIDVDYQVRVDLISSIRNTELSP